MKYTLESIDTLPLKERAHVDPLKRRKGIRVKDLARLRVKASDGSYLYPWVEVVERTPTGYVGVTGGFGSSPAWLPYGTRVAFAPEHVVET